MVEKYFALKYYGEIVAFILLAAVVVAWLIKIWQDNRRKR